MRVLASFVATSALGRSALRLQTNPITRVCDLLGDLSKKLEHEGKEEKKTFNKYTCWCTKVQQQKRASIASAEGTITEKQNYITELDSGRVELTDERTRIEAQITELRKDVKQLEGDRAKEVKDYEATKEESQQTIDALDAAIQKLDEAKPDESLASISGSVSRAMMMAEGKVKQSDVRFVEGAVNDQNPDGSDYNNKKLNEKATHTQDYKLRSGKIRKVLVAMNETFTTNLAELEEAEVKHKSDYDTLHGAKSDELSAAVEAQTAMAEEKGARAKAKQEAEDDIDALTEQKDNDKTFLTQTNSSCTTKAAEFATRQGLRTDEIASINEAISILRSDDARDTFKKSFESQSFLQVDVKQAKCRVMRAHAAAAVLRSASPSLKLLAQRTELLAPEGGENSFSTIIVAIDKMVTELRAEADVDVTKKADCDKQRSTKTAEAKVESKEIDKANARIEELKSEISTLRDEVASTNSSIADLRVDLRTAELNREEEHNEYVEDKLDDETAKSLVEQAHGVLQQRYEGLALAQTKHHAPVVADGEAPPPPPATFEGDYKGAQGAASGILAILETIKEDIQHDINKADKEESDALSAYTALKTEMETSITDKESHIGTLEGQIGDKLGEISDKETERTGDEGDLEGVMGVLKSITPGCDFIAVNFDTRVENRNAEIDGLKKAKAMLQGAKFPSGPDGSFLQNCP